MNVRPLLGPTKIMQIPKPKKGEHRKKRKAMNDAQMKAFREKVLALDEKAAYLMNYDSLPANRLSPNVICCNPHCKKPSDRFGERSYYEVAHLCGKGRDPKHKYDPRYAMRLCWQCHDWIDKRNDVGEFSADERKIEVLTFWKHYPPEGEIAEYVSKHFDSRGWALPLEALEASVARRKVGT